MVIDCSLENKYVNYSCVKLKLFRMRVSLKKIAGDLVVRKNKRLHPLCLHIIIAKRGLITNEPV